MLARNYLGVGFLRGLNSAAEVFAPYSDRHEQQAVEGRRPTRPMTSIISAHWSGPLPPVSELERLDQIIPGGADRLLRMAEKEQTHRIEDAKRGQYLGWSLAAGAVIAAALVSLCHGPWQVSVALVGIPVLGAVHALIQGRKEKSGKRAIRWF
jgi:Predicted membrane protein (DUF2335)